MKKLVYKYIHITKTYYHNYKARKKFDNDLTTFKSKSDSRFSINNEDNFPCLNDNTNNTGFDAHYVYHPAWATRIIKDINPSKHIDISSTLHFCSQLSAYVPVDFYDYRPANLTLPNLKTLKGDLMNLDFSDNSVESISCMHTVEHIGLGRYGDPIDPIGDLKAIEELKRVVAKGGSLLFVVPVGKARIQFNAHRIYSFEMILSCFEGFELKNFSLITDLGDFIWNANPEIVSNQKYGCGCFWLIKS